MNLLDLGIIVLLGLITVRGYYRGLFQELAVLVGVVGGVVVAAHLYLRLAILLHRWVADPLYARWIAFGIIFVAVYWAIRLVAHFLQRLFYHLYLDFFDRVLGGTFALAKGALLVGFSLMFLMMVLPKDSHLLKGSVAVPKLVSFSRQSLGLLPPDFKKRMKDYLKDWEKPRDKYQAEGFWPPKHKQPPSPAVPRRIYANWPRA
ncbi:MAG TPA: CvpA family protein [Desulfobaccales bacterium]|nr:CvpA family protein [Desulfobaccales bacterium]